MIVSVKRHRALLLGWLILVGLLSDCARAHGKSEPKLERKKLEQKTGQPFDKRKAKLRPIGPTAGAAFVSKVPIVAGGVLVGTGAKHWGPANEWTLLDVTTGAVRAKVKDVGEGSAA